MYGHCDYIPSSEFISLWIVLFHKGPEFRVQKPGPLSYGYPGGYDSHALARINYLLRDFRTGEEHPIDPKLLDILFDVRRNFGGRGTFAVISGYRSPKTNKQLCARSSGVAKHSLHMVGKAIDVRLIGVRTKKIQQCALGLKRGGVGFYAKSDFVHLDTGRVRHW
ncbi:MAG TPA: DUF882 domain-containing protein [Desulfobulbaceae bacterium]|nr:DUF882 domain-containing protein [Desulfobulbaceae bacterium]